MTANSLEDLKRLEAALVKLFPNSVANIDGTINTSGTTQLKISNDGMGAYNNKYDELCNTLNDALNAKKHIGSFSRRTDQEWPLRFSVKAENMQNAITEISKMDAFSLETAMLSELDSAPARHAHAKPKYLGAAIELGMAPDNLGSQDIRLNAEHLREAREKEPASPAEIAAILQEVSGKQWTQIPGKPFFTSSTPIPADRIEPLKLGFHAEGIEAKIQNAGGKGFIMIGGEVKLGALRKAKESKALREAFKGQQL